MAEELLPNWFFRFRRMWGSNLFSCCLNTGVALDTLCKREVRTVIQTNNYCDNIICETLAFMAKDELSNLRSAS